MTNINLNYATLRESDSLGTFAGEESYSTDDIGSFAAGADAEALKFLIARYDASVCELTFFDGRTLLFDLIHDDDSSERITVVFEIAED